MTLKLNDILQTVVNNVDGALGCAVVDLESGLLLSVAHNVPYFTSSYLEAVAAAAVDMMRGNNIRAVESLLSNQSGKVVEKMIKEIQMTTENTLHFMAIIPNKPDALIVLITNKKTNLEIAWSTVRNLINSVEPLCP